MGFSWQEYWSGLPFPSPGDFGWKSIKGLPSWNSSRTRQEPVPLSGLEQEVGKILKLSCESTGRGLLVHYHKVILPHQNSNEFWHLPFMTGIPRKNEAKSTQLLEINVVQGEDELGIGHETFLPVHPAQCLPESDSGRQTTAGIHSATQSSDQLRLSLVSPSFPPRFLLMAQTDQFGFLNMYLFIWLPWVLVVTWKMGLQELSSLTRDQTQALCTASWILNHWTTRLVWPVWFFDRIMIICFP